MTLRAEDLRGEAADAFRMWHDFFGLSEESALRAVAQDGLVEESEVDGLAGSLASIFSLSEGAARVAARGRESVSGTRGWDSSRSSGDAFAVAQEALSRMSDAECDAMLEEQQRRRKAKKASPAQSGGSAKKQTTVSEWGWRG